MGEANEQKVWDSGLALSAWLGRYVGAGARRHQHAAAIRVLERVPSARIVELGSGTGLVSIALKPLAPQCRVTATDLGELW